MGVGQLLGKILKRVVVFSQRLPDYLFEFRSQLCLLLSLVDFNLLDGAPVHCLAWRATGGLKRLGLDFTADPPFSISSCFTFD